MTRRFTRILAALALLVGLTIPLGMWGQNEVVAYTFATEKNTSNTAYATNYDITVSDIVWSCPGNQNFEGYVRIGGKSIDAVDRNIYSKNKLDAQNPYNVTKITVNHHGVSNANLTVNSVKVIVANDASFSNTVETITLTPSFSVGTQGSFDFTPTQTWTSEYFYKFVINVSNSKSSNYGLDLNSIVFYKENDGPALEDSDLAITGAPVALSFDLYNNSSAQTVSYTTSSTGAITITPETSTYFSYVHNAANKTITVTPLAVTPSAQTVTISQAADDDYYGGTATFTVAVANSDPNQPGTEGNPYTVAEAIAAIDAQGTINEAYVTGIVCQVDSYNSNYHSITYWISDDETTTTRLEVYSGKGIDGADFNSVEDIQVEDIVVVKGKLKKYNSTYEFDYNNELVSLVRPQYPTIDATAGSALAYYATTGNITYEIGNYVAGTMTATTAVDWISNFTYSQEDEMGEVNFSVTPNTGTARTANVTLTYSYGNNQTVTAVVEVSQNGVPSVTVAPDAVTVAAAGDYPEFAISFESLEITSASNFDVTFFDATGTTPTTQPDWITDYDISAETTGYVLTLEVDENTGSQRVAYLKVYALDDNEIEKYSNLVTITQSAPANTTIDLRGTTTAVSFTPGNYSSLTNSYGDYSNVTYTGSNNVEYSGWSLHQVLKSSGNLQMKKEGAGYVEMPTILTDYGFAIAVTAVTNSVEIVLDEESGTNTLTTAETSADVVIQTGSSYAVISTITITPLSAPAEYTLTVSNLSHVNLYTFETGDDSDMLIENEGSVDIYNGTQVFFSVDVHSGYILQSLVVDGNDVTDQIEDGDVYFYTMPDHDVTVTATAVLAPATDDYELFSGELVEGDYIIYYNGYAMKNTAVAVGTNRLAYEIVTPSSSDIISTYDASIVWHIAPSDDYWTIYNAAENKYAASTGTKNQAQMLADGTDNKSLWTVSGSSTYEFVNKYNSSNSVNSNLRNNGTNGWACYSTSTGGALSLYKKVEPTPEPLTLPIAANQWYLISSPVGTINLGTSQQPTNNVGNLTTGTYGLYSFDQTGGGENGDGKEWRNYKAGAFSQLEAGKGYLYINENSCTLTFPGTAYSTPDGSATFPIDYYTSNPTTSFRGLNLVGNPFNEDAAINLPFYKMNAAGSEIEAASGLVHPMEGVFVVASETVNSVTFQTGIGYGGGDEKFSLNLTQNRGNVIDRAIVRFDEGGQLPKVQLFENSTKLYIPQNGKDYAIVSTEAQGELPVNFRASENGTYTLSMDVENMDMNYLHLIDNMTGMDIDLLQTPSYTFEATTRDYESRFRLVFAGASTGSATSDNFAFFSNGNLIINNEGNATLQVVDLTGRILSSETINGSVSTTINAVPGVYMLRLINGENVNVQKIVVR